MFPNNNTVPQPPLADMGPAAAAAAAAAARYAGLQLQPPGAPAGHHAQPQLPAVPAQAMGAWAMANAASAGAGQKQQQQQQQQQYATFKDECAECYIRRDELFLFSCGHYPYCAKCMKLLSYSTPGALNCPACRKQVSDVRRVYGVRKVKKM